MKNAKAAKAFETCRKARSLDASLSGGATENQAAVAKVCAWKKKIIKKRKRRVKAAEESAYVKETS